MKAQFFKVLKKGEQMLGEVLLDSHGQAYASTDNLARVLKDWTIFEYSEGKEKPISMTDGAAYIEALAKTRTNGYFFVKLIKS